MFRICTIAALIALTTTAAQTTAQADTLAQRIHDAAVKACAVESVPNMSPHSHYDAISDVCVYRISRAATAKYEALAKAGTQTAEPSKLANN